MNYLEASLVAMMAVAGCTQRWTAPVEVDREARVEGARLSSSTQSINRGHSVLRTANEIQIIAKDDQLSFTLPVKNGRVRLGPVPMGQLVPVLPYNHPETLSPFDAVNLMLAEYARNGVGMSYQTANSEYATFSDQDVFEAGEEYRFDGTTLQPVPTARPKRMSVTNNCLAPGLWEVAAKDSVGELYHGWFQWPEEAYATVVRSANNLGKDAKVMEALAYRKELGDVTPDWSRLRTAGDLLWESHAVPVASKKVGGYSTQDARRKVQRKFVRLLRGEQPAPAKTFGDLQSGDVFSLYKFQPPGVYTTEDPLIIPYDAGWVKATIRSVVPKTRYPQSKPGYGNLGHVELILRNDTKDQSIVVGNLPVALLVPQEDYAVPAFGVGVLPPSEIAERRILRLREGPAPHYAYLLEGKGDGGRILNNHEVGLEQIFVRSIQRDGAWFLRVNLVAYERMIDLLELEIPVSGDLAEQLAEAARIYRSPLYKVYRDEALN